LYIVAAFLGHITRRFVQTGTNQKVSVQDEVLAVANVSYWLNIYIYISNAPGKPLEKG
jgi:hypothetical protein